MLAPLSRQLSIYFPAIHFLTHLCFTVFFGSCCVFRVCSVLPRDSRRSNIHLSTLQVLIHLCLTVFFVSSCFGVTLSLLSASCNFLPTSVFSIQFRCEPTVYFLLDFRSCVSLYIFIPSYLLCFCLSSAFNPFATIATDCHT